MSILIHILLAINLIVAILIILVTLMQRPKQEGLGAAFGGGMTENLFGAQTTNVLVTITRWLGGIFFAVTLVISALYARQATTKSSIQQGLLNAPKPEQPAASPTPAATPAPEAGESKAPETAAPVETPAPAETPAAVAPEATPAPAPATEAPAAEAPAAPAESPAATPAP